MTPLDDSGYKLLFSHPRLVRELLSDWVPGDWISEADFSTLERVNGSYVAESQKQRHDDMVWRLRLKDRWLWVYLVLEFQFPLGGQRSPFPQGIRSTSAARPP